MDIPPSMRAEPARWNDGSGIDLQSWINGSGSYALAIGYLTVFWPDLVEIDDCIVHRGVGGEQIRRWRGTPGATRRDVERVLNHLHLADLHTCDSADLSEDKFVALGSALPEIYAAKLAWQFPQRPCTVEFIRPGAGGSFAGYQLTFWQNDS